MTCQPTSGCTQCGRRNSCRVGPAALPSSPLTRHPDTSSSVSAVSGSFHTSWPALPTYCYGLYPPPPRCPAIGIHPPLLVPSPATSPLFGRPRRSTVPASLSGRPRPSSRLRRLPRNMTGLADSIFSASFMAETHSSVFFWSTTASLLCPATAGAPSSSQRPAIFYSSLHFVYVSEYLPVN